LAATSEYFGASAMLLQKGYSPEELRAGVNSFIGEQAVSFDFIDGAGV
jgi:hypothetical protein